MRRVTLLIGALALLPAGPALAAGDTAAAETARIAAERQAVEARFAAAQADCGKRFLVNDCLQEARVERRAALEPLQRQQLMLDDVRRRERAADRLRSIQEQVREQALKSPQPAVRARKAGSAPVAGAASTPASASAVPAEHAVAPVAVSRDRPDPAVAAAQRAQRVQAAQDHAEAVRQRNAQHDARRPPAAGLPLPAAGASSP